MKHHFSAIQITLVVLSCLLMALLLNGCSHSASHATEATAASAATASHDAHATPAATEIAQNVPHYFDDPEQAKPFPKTLDPDSMKTAAAKQAYAIARRIPEVLAQQPCYCYCDRGHGHGSLLHCHIDNHSAD